MFVGNSVCCQDRGIVTQGADLRLWLVCNRDVYLPAAKCLTGAPRTHAWAPPRSRRLLLPALLPHARRLPG